MDKKEEFKSFVKQNPSLISYVHNGDMTWQKFYEMYDINGENKEVWKDYLTRKETTATAAATATAASTVGLADVFKWVKSIDLDSFQNGIGSLQKVVGVLQDLTGKTTTEGDAKETYKPRPLYRHFED